MAVFGIPNVTLLRAVDFLGLLIQDCLMRSTSSSDVLGRPVDFYILTVPVSLNWFIHRFRALSVGGFFLDVNFATYAALRQPTSVLHTTTQIEPSGEPSTSCCALIKTERQWRNCSKVTRSPTRAHDSPPAWTSPQHLKVTHLWFPWQWWAPPLFKLSLILKLI